MLESPGSAAIDLYEREVRLLLRDTVAVRSLAERILDNAIMYVMTSLERPGLHLGVGKTVDIGVHQLILDTPSTSPCVGCTTRAATSTMPR